MPGANSQAYGLLVSPRLPFYLVALVLSLGLPSLERGFDGDDSMQKVWLLGSPRFPSLDEALLHSRPVLDLHVVVDPRARARQMDVGVLPWWTGPNLRIQCLRVLTALTHWLDHRLWPDTWPLMHAHSLLWAALCLVAATLLYRRLFGPLALVGAGLATCLFAFDNAPGTAAYTVTYRNVLVALFFGILAVLAHVRNRDEGWKPGAVFAPIFLAAALFSAEVGVGTLAYLVAHAVFLDRDAPWKRVKGLMPCVLVGVVWQLVYAGSGYGVGGSGAYINPPAEPLRFLGALVQRVPFFLLGQWMDIDLMIVLLGEGRRLWVAGVASSLVVAALLLPRLRTDALARFWAAGMVLSLVPLCAVIPSGRRLLFASLGSAALLAQLFASAVNAEGAQPRWRRMATLLVCMFLASSRLLLNPALMLLKAQAPPYPTGMNAAMVPLAYTVERQTLVVLNPPTAVGTMWLPYVQAVQGRAVPRRVRGLAASASSGTATRIDDHTLAVRVNGGYLTKIEDTAFRSPGLSMKPGDRIELTGTSVEVVSTKEDGRPWEVRFRFDVPLEDPTLRWLQWRKIGYAPFRPPALGEAVAFTPEGAQTARPAAKPALR